MFDNIWIGIILFTATSFVVGLSGAMVPGPMLTVTISDSLKKGVTAGPKIVIGHILVEFLLILLIFAGLGWLFGSGIAIVVIGIIGGSIMVIMGFQMAISSNSLEDLHKNSENSKGYSPVLNGILTSISNPYFFIWWATVGWAFMLKGIELAGILGVVGFLTGHWFSDLGWFSTVSFFTTKGSNIMKDNHYKIIMSVSGIFLMALGVYFMISSYVL